MPSSHKWPHRPDSWKNFIFGSFYILIFIWADTPGLLLWRSKAPFSNFGLKSLFHVLKKKKVPIYVGGRWGHLPDLPEKLSMLSPSIHRMPGYRICDYFIGSGFCLDTSHIGVKCSSITQGGHTLKNFSCWSKIYF